MAEEKGFYRVNAYGDHLEPGEKLKIEHSIYSQDDATQLSKWTHLPADKLQALRDGSAASEKEIFEKLRGAVKEWEEQAANTMLLDDAIEYVKTAPVKHTSNEWVAGQHSFECSNMVYKMTYQIREDIPYRSKTPIAWDVSWSLYYNFPDHNRGGGHIAGQDKKRFTTKEKMDNYLIGRMAAFSDYFTELSPPVPQNLAWKFSRHGKLLPGYTVQAPEPPVKVSEAPGTDYSKFINKRPQRDGERNTGRSAR